MRFRYAVLTAAVATGLVACAKSENKTDTSTSAANTANAVPAAKHSDSTLRIAMIAKSSTNPVFLAARTGAEETAKQLGDQNHMKIEIMWLTPPQEDGQVQAQRIQQAVNDGADAILISCSDAGKVTGAINDAVGRGVQVMTFDSDAPQ